MMTRVFGGISSNIHYDLDFKSPIEVENFNPTSTFVHNHFANYKRNFVTLKQAAIANPLKFYRLLSSNYSSYIKKHGSGTNTWEKANELDYTIQHYANSDSVPYRKRQQDLSPSYPIVLSSMEKIAENITNVYSTESLTSPL
jgi:hypothetical protein